MYDRFVNKSLSELEEANRSPIYGYQHLPILTLEEATIKLIPFVSGVVDYVSIAKDKCNQNSTLLTRDESAAIYLYTMPIPFFSRLNDALRAEDRHALNPWFAYLKLFITALEKLPSTKATVWRGVNCDVNSTFVSNDAHTWWNVNSCSKALSVVEQYLGATATVFAIDTIHSKDISTFSTFPEEQEIVLMPGTCVHRKCQSINFEGRFSLVHLKEETTQSESQIEQNYLFNLIKQEYQRQSHIARIMNPSKSFPIEENYINLSIMETKEQQLKEKKLLDVKQNNEIIGTYEEIYGTKTNIEIKDIFQKCNNEMKNILVVGRAGIGKTTFCRYVAYQWATGTIWKQYDLVIFIRLHNLTESRYPPLTADIQYCLTDLIKTEYFQHGLSEKDEKLLKEQFEKSQVLWLLDGYDEIVQNIPSHLQYLLEQLLETPHHILTSRPSSFTLSYDVQLEVTGFTNDNINNYVKQFFDETKDEIYNTSVKTQKLLSFLQCNPKIWGIVHIPVNLELICSLWCDNDWSETIPMTMTSVYDKITEWFCRRHLEKQNISSIHMSKHDIYAHCHKELAFLESLAFNGMESNNVILHSNLLQIAFKKSECSLHHEPSLFNIGILKFLDHKPVDTYIEEDKNYYFVHLSFQEHFAARYLVKALHGSENQKQNAIDFIKTHKYNQRFELVFTFASGLLIDNDDQQCINLFLDTLWEERLDVIGLRHVLLLISCLEETGCDRTLSRFSDSMNAIIKWINYFITEEDFDRGHPLFVLLRRSPSLVNKTVILDKLIKLYNHEDPRVKMNTIRLISDLPISNPHSDLICLYLKAFNDPDLNIRRSACVALGKIGDEAATIEIINLLVRALGDMDFVIRSSACEAISNLGKKAETTEIINQLARALDDMYANVRSSACVTLAKMGEKAATTEIIIRLVVALGDIDAEVRSSARIALDKMSEKAPTDEIIKRIVSALGNMNAKVRIIACKALSNLNKKAATTEIINLLVSALGDIDFAVRSSACEALGKMGKTAATTEVINQLVSALEDSNATVRSSACTALGEMSGKATTTGIINRLVNALEDSNASVRMSACVALGRMGENTATTEIINRLISALGDPNTRVISIASMVIRKMDKKAVTTEIINGLVSALRDTDVDIRIRACKALSVLGKKAETTEIINQLVSALEDSNATVRSNACIALGEMSRKATTTEIINRLVSVFGDSDASVRISACVALGKIGEEAATTEIINRLVSALGDPNANVRCSACFALSKMGEKAATNEVIEILLNILSDDEYWMIREKNAAIRKILESFSCLSDLKSGVVAKLLKRLKELQWHMEIVSPEKLIRAFLDTQIWFWLPIIKAIFISNGYCFTLTQNIVIVYGNKKPMELTFSNREVCQKLQNYFVNKMDESSKHVDES